ncbi:ApeA N-terminal domain 1-containing protein [Massilia haematophila]|uniref:HEPN domain-containing protein n=1 Tax=Massilia haematophila TaxID=457923 RepID=A0ABV7PQJ0_9BURK
MGERYLGTYGERDHPHHTGELVVDGKETRLKFIGQGLESLHNATTIYGKTEKNEKVSCLDCFVTKTARPFFDSGEHFERLEMLPNFVLIGKEHIDPTQPVVQAARFKFTDTKLFFEDRNAFGAMFKVSAELQSLFDTRLPPVQRTAGKDSLLSYFSGDFNIVKCENDLGIFSAGYSFNVESGSPFTYDIDLTLKFNEAIHFHECLRRISAIRRFFTVLTGRPQAFLHQELVVSCATASGDSSATPLRMHLANPPSGPSTPASKYFIDAPIHPHNENQPFACVMRDWLSVDEARHMSRRQYVECVEDETRYTTGRLVAAANMFDTLPADALPPDVTLPEDFENAVSESVAIFESLPKTDFRDSMLGHFKRLKKPSLPAKVYYRSSLICSRMAEPLPNLNDVLRIGCRFRNFLVHGDPKFPYRKYESLLPFLTDTLEFVFAASDLIDAGWDIEQWCVDNIWGNHKFTIYRRDYPQWIEVFMTAKNGP